MPFYCPISSVKALTAELTQTRKTMRKKKLQPITVVHANAGTEEIERNML